MQLVGAAAAGRLVQPARDSGVDSGFPAHASGALQEGMNAGFGTEDLTALIKVLRACA
jgi:hypothetical protein